ncbi:MAG: DinB family protein [Phaeodactylibacter sp.]|nr:DinB family protein [Phaeodactylibacter sp.]
MDCKEGTVSITRQINQLLEHIHPKAYSRPLGVFNASTIGQHFRHIFDFYECLLRGASEGIVDYASRSRNEKMEKDPSYARAAFQQMGQACIGLNEEQPLKVRADFSSLPDDGRPELGSTVGRELMFAYDHAVHHLALIKIGMKEALPEIEIDEQMGVAPSTLKHRNRLS